MSQPLFFAPDENIRMQNEALYALLYALMYVAYLFVHLETEIGHWLSLVLIPLFLICFRRDLPKERLKSVLTSIGLHRAHLHRGLVAGASIGLAISFAQLYLSRNRTQIWEMFISGRAAYLLPLTFLLMLVLAGFTEEFFFRGVLQTRLALRYSNLTAVLATSFVFGLYHLPYAYLHPKWPSHGDWPAACGAAFGQGIPAGLILGTIYGRSKNLLASVVCHALINTLPGMLQIKIGK